MEFNGILMPKNEKQIIKFITIIINDVFVNYN